MFIKAKGGDKNTVVYYDKKGNKTIRKGGTRAWRNNNPGNIRKSSFAYKNGAIGHAGGFAVFATYAAGRKALQTLLQGKTYSKLTIFRAIARYAPHVENDTTNYQKLVKQITKLDLKRKIDSLNDGEMKKLIDAIERIEGYSKGTEEYIEIKSIIDAQKGKTGSLTRYQLDDETWISKDEAIELTEKGNVANAVVVRPMERNTYLRSKPDKTKNNNFKVMAAS